MAHAWRDAAGSLVADLRRIFGDRLRSVSVYGARADAHDGSGPLTCLALVTSLTAADHDACGRAVHGWRRAGLATPLILPEQEFLRSVDVFPLEYAEMQRAHVVVYGGDPFAALEIPREDLRRACEAQVKSHLLHLREEYLESSGRPLAIAELVQASAPAFAALLRNVARLHDVSTHDRVEATREGARVANVPDGVVAEVLMLEGADGMGAADPARLFPQYLQAVEQLARFVDTWRA